MALRAKVLQIKAKKFEVKKSQVRKVTKEQACALEPLLQDVYFSRRPKPTDYEARRDLVRVFNEIAKEIYGNSNDIPVVVEFGSFVMDLFSTSSDLDLSVNFSANAVAFPRDKKIQTLRKFAKKLYAIQSKGHVCGVLPITTAKVPILKCVDRGTGVECDISVENRDGILKSQIIHIISSIDERFPKLSFLMKLWAKAHNINSSKDKTLNSLSIILLVAFHLQTRDPPILPPFSAIFKDGTDPATLVNSLPNFVNYGEKNQESLAELFITLLIKLSSVEKLWSKGLCASAFDGHWTSKTYDSKVACISVEDFTDRSQNVARAVGQAELKQIYKCIDSSIRHIFSFMDGQIGVNVRDLLFGQDGIPITIPRNLRPIGQANHGRRVTGKRKKQANSTLTNRITQVDASTKKMRTGEVGWRGMPRNGIWETANVETQHALPSSSDPTGKQQMSARGWEEVQQPSSRGWSTNIESGWGVTQQSSSRGWVTNVESGWGVTQPSSSRGWVTNVESGWGVTQPSSSRGCVTNVESGWGVTQPSSSRGWVTNVESGWGVNPQTSTGGWGVTPQTSVAGWGVNPQPTSGGWVGNQPHIAGGWGRNSDAQWRKGTYHTGS